MNTDRVLIIGTETFKVEVTNLLKAVGRAAVSEEHVGEYFEREPQAFKKGRETNVPIAAILEIQIPKDYGPPKNLVTFLKSAVEHSSVPKGCMCVIYLPNLSDKDHVIVTNELLKCDHPLLEIARGLAEAVSRVLEWYQRTPTGAPEEINATFVLDQVPGITKLTADLRDDQNGRIDAKRIAALFGISLADIARYSHISRQSLDKNPTSNSAQSVLELFERIARLRALGEFHSTSAFRKWFKTPLPVFDHKSALELFLAGKLNRVAETADRLLTGDFGG